MYAFQVKTIPSTLPVLGGKSFYDAAFLLRDVSGSILPTPLVAIACADNTIRVVDAFRLTVHHVLVSGLTSPVSCMLVIPCPTAGGDWLIVGERCDKFVHMKPCTPFSDITCQLLVLQSMFPNWCCAIATAVCTHNTLQCSFFGSGQILPGCFD